MLQWKISKLINFRWPLQWRHVERDGVSNHQPHDCLLNRLFRRRSKKTSKLRVTGLCEGNSPGTGEFPAQRASYAENVSIWWRHHGLGKVLAKEETTHMMSPLIGLYIQNKYLFILWLTLTYLHLNPKDVWILGKPLHSYHWDAHPTSRQTIKAFASLTTQD